MASSRHTKNPIQHRQIRALYDETTVTVYQAYNSAIADAAVGAQRLDASPLFKPARMTWIKPSWNWMMYRAGYSFKDANQTNILALRLRRGFFEKLLAASVESESEEAKRDGEQVRIQWDPERNVRIQKLSSDGRVRSIQIGIPNGWKGQWLNEGIVTIEDVTDRARQLKKVLDQEPAISEEDLINQGLVPRERIYDLPEDITRVVGLSKAGDRDLVP